MVERRAGIGPAFCGWEPQVLPLYDGRVSVPSNQAYQTCPTTGELVVGVPLEHFETSALADPRGVQFDGKTAASPWEADTRVPFPSPAPQSPGGAEIAP